MNTPASLDIVVGEGGTTFLTGETDGLVVGEKEETKESSG